MLELPHKLILKENQPYLVEHINLMSLLPHLNAQQLLSDAENEELQLRQVPEHDRIIRLLTILQKKGESDFQNFLTALKQASDHTPHHDVVEKLKYYSHGSTWKTEVGMLKQTAGQQRPSTLCSMDGVPLQNQQDSYQGKIYSTFNLFSFLHYCMHYYYVLEKWVDRVSKAMLHTVMCIVISHYGYGAGVALGSQKQSIHA